MKRLLLDTNVCIRLLNPNRSQSLIEKFRKTDPGLIVLCSIVKAELYYGAYRSTRRKENLALLSAFFAAFDSLPFDERCEKIYGQVRAELARNGNLVGPNDLLIGATALAYETILVTHNTREFSRFPNLEIEDWES